MKPLPRFCPRPRDNRWESDTCRHIDEPADAAIPAAEAPSRVGPRQDAAKREVVRQVGWCRFGLQNAVGLAIELELRYRGLRAPHKFTFGVSGCARECAEARAKDVGIIASANGWNMYVGGNGGCQPAHGQLLATDLEGGLKHLRANAPTEPDPSIALITERDQIRPATPAERAASGTVLLSGSRIPVRKE